jgi:flagellar basal-body rod modification protein FlgD
MIKVGDNTYTPGTSGSTSSTKSSTSSKDTSDQFMSLLLAQMTNQNPLEPMNDTEMVNQMVSMNSLTELQKISKAITSLTQTNQFVSASALMDKTVTYLNDDNEPVSGVVKGVFLDDTEVFLKVGETAVPLSGIVKVENTVETE